MWLRVALAFTLAVAAAAQPKGTGVIGGMVVDEHTGAPLRKAIITLTWHGTPQAWAQEMSDGSGLFRFDNLPPGEYELAAARDGYLMRAWSPDGKRTFGQRLTLKAGEIKTTLTLRLPQLGGISGTVADAEGDPAVRAQVMLYVVGYPRGGRELVQRNGITTDDRGEFRITNVPPGTYYIGVRGSGFMGPMQPGSGLTTQYFPGVSDWRKATPVPVAPGQRLEGMHLRLGNDQPVPVSGRVLGVPPAVEGEQPTWVHISLLGDFGGPGIGANPPDYTFTFPNVAPGDYKLVVRWGDRKLWAVRRLHVEGPVEDLALTLAPPTDLKGSLRLEGVQAADPSAYRITLTQGDRPPMTNPVETKPAADGTFVLQGVPPGIWDINVQPIPKGGFLKSMHLGKQDVLTEEMEIGPDTKAPLNIVLSGRGAQLEGTIEGGKRGFVVLAPAGKFRHVMSFYSSAVSDEAGKFKLIAITPGDYRLFAFDDMPREGARDPEFLDTFKEQALLLSIAEGAKLNAAPKPIPLGKPEGQP